MTVSKILKHIKDQADIVSDNIAPSGMSGFICPACGCKIASAT